LCLRRRKPPVAVGHPAAADIEAGAKGREHLQESLSNNAMPFNSAFSLLSSAGLTSS
jgi:hypothetical protein